MHLINLTHLLRPSALRRHAFLLTHVRCATGGCLGFEHKELTVALKHRIERHWQPRLASTTGGYDPASLLPKKYVLSMFPYPSGHLHMGHVRVYAISDAMARFYRMRGHNVLHPMGWDAFGLPAENAARQRGIAAADWTRTNIAEMRAQFERLGCSFDWPHEVATCEPTYYRWTQWLFVRLHAAGLAYQREALVNWDPVDGTVLADEQVDAQGCSWRSGARVEKKLLKQWFVRTTRFAGQLLAGLNDPTLQDWRDVIKLQRHWIGECTGYRFEVPLDYGGAAEAAPDAVRLRSLSVWTQRPADWRRAGFVAVSAEHVLNGVCASVNGVLTDVCVRNPFDGGRRLPVIVDAAVEFEPDCDTYVGVPASRAEDAALARRLGLQWVEADGVVDEVARQRVEADVLQQAQQANIGGWPVSAKLRDWPISRQRAWGTPIPIVHCDSCGPVPVAEESLPVLLPDAGTAAAATDCVPCPRCQSPKAHRETDTMDTFVDSSWYFLRFMDPHNDAEPFGRDSAERLAPVDLYVGGKEHAVLHLYYARFVSHFLHSIGRVPQPEPFRRLLVQGMVMGRAYRVKGSGRYVRAAEVRVLDEKRGRAETVDGAEPVVMQWEKMSKSKQNGADPVEAIAEHGTDSIRLIMLGDVAPTSHRNWSEATFPGILNWQKRLWLTLGEFNEIRCSALAGEPDDVEAVVAQPEFRENDERLYDARNYFLKEATFNFQYTHQLSVAISKMQGLTNAIRRSPKATIKYSVQYERALAASIQMLAPLAPHFASELWSLFCAVPGRRSAADLVDLHWERDVLQQHWPIVDADYRLDLVYKVNGVDLGVGKYTAAELERLTADQALVAALTTPAVQDFVGDSPILSTGYVHYAGCEASVTMSVQRRAAADGAATVAKVKAKKAKSKVTQ